MKLIFFTLLFVAWTANYNDAVMPDNDNSDPDIIYGDIHRESYERAMTRQQTNFGAYPFRRWPGRSIKGTDYKAVIPIYIIPKNYSDTERARIMQAIDEWNRVMGSCIHYFRLPTTKGQKNYVEVIPKSGCSSDIGKIEDKKVQYMSLTEACTLGDDHQVTILHEMEHAAGMNHEHQRYDRNDYIKVNLDVVPQRYRGEFTIPANGQYEDYKTYDYESIMHYPFSRNVNGTYFDILKKGVNETSVGRGTRDKKDGQGISFSRGDVEKLYNLYDCPLPDPFPELPKS